ncbi:MAG: hypothetical protein DMD81_06295 [Candidatus Rokuibacteriota bacterium]|nr:MAG: hypothetical protein DMD81_06295 [Candidatus Rokubacteria bacterium]
MSLAKILTLDAVAERLAELRATGVRIVQCHGCFDLMHIGHIKHLQAAKRMGDTLVVTVTADEYVAKGAGRPVFGEFLRAEALAALECVDFVAINAGPTAVEAIRLLRPHYYVKGQAYAMPSARSERLRAEIAAVHDVGGEIRFTNEIVFSSTALLNARPRD